MKITIDKLKESLTLDEQNELLEDLLSMEILAYALAEFIRLEGKTEESKKFVQKVMEEITAEDLKKGLDKK